MPESDSSNNSDKSASVRYVSERTAAQQVDILMRLDARLNEQHIRTRFGSNCYKLTLRRQGQAGVVSELTVSAPKLHVFASQGQRIATVGVCSRCNGYLLDAGLGVLPDPGSVTLVGDVATFCGRPL
ncbi:hypothetical protein GCM10009560_62550 [Nonomuraea longicatena]|uniref:Uncharacterized protein n=1 Tax=Nonomuraea longicatena TaxID=83682 RepID=A0ABP4BCE5_9ACTN